MLALVSPREGPYIGLDATKQQIRLLSFPSTTNMDLEMEIFDIATCPKYDALSYTWGIDNDATNCDTLLNGWPITIRENLFDALHALFVRERQQSKAPGTPGQSARLYYWIDALCINQDSLPERNQQVQLMGLIYSQAALVRVWLGDECAQALKVSKYEQKSKAYLLEPFFEAKYWTRLWTIQEFELAQDIVFMAGDAVVMLTEWLEILNEIGIAPDDMELQDRGLEGGGSRLTRYSSRLWSGCGIVGNYVGVRLRI